MLISVDKIKDYKLSALNGEVGSIKEFFFDDKFWTIRYIVVNTGSWLNRKQVLISPYFLADINHGTEVINVNLMKDEIENSPSVDSDKPVSRQYEESYYNYYGAPVYWGGSFAWGNSPLINRDKESWKNVQSQEKNWDPNLRSSKDVTGHNIQATDQEIGKVDNFIIDDENWSIRYLIVDTGKWLPGRKVLISPSWIDRISWDDSKVFVNVTSETVRNSPEFDESEGLTREYETDLYGYYGRPPYWREEAVYGDYSKWVKR